MPENRWKGAGAATNNWRTATNWTLNHIPTDDEDVVIVNGSVELKGGLGEAKTLELDPGLTLDVTVGNSSGHLAVSGNLTNHGTIKLNGGGNTSTLNFDMASNFGVANILGGGTIRLTDSDKNSIISGVRGVTLNNVDNTIIGAGEFGKGTAIALTNQADGKIIAKGTEKLSIYFGSLNGGVRNLGLFEDQGTGGLEFYRTKVNNTGGVIQALKAGSHVDIADSSITGGLLKTSAGGVIQTLGNSNLIASLTNQGHILVNPNTTLAIRGAIQNTGRIELDADGTQARIQVHADDARLTGIGFLTLSDDDGNIVYGAGQGAELTNFLGHVISGAGSIGHGNLTIHNYGLITATGIQNELTFRSVDPSTNHGVLSATGPAGLVIANSTVNSAGGGQIIANAPGAHVDLAAARLQGGTLRSTGAGAEIQTVARNNQFDGQNNTLTNNATVVVNDRTSLELRGNIKNAKIIFVDGDANQTDLKISGNGAKLTGKGDIKLSNSDHNNIAGLTGSSKLTNQDNDIFGAGTVSHMTLVNSATIRAIYDGNALILKTGKTITNNGLLVADGGHLVVDDPVIGTGHALISGDGVLDIDTGFIEATVFGTGAGELNLGDKYGGGISGFRTDDKIDLEFLSYVPTDKAVWDENSSYTGGTLKIVNAGGSVRASLNLTGLGPNAEFKIVNDGGNKAGVRLVTLDKVTTGTTKSDKLNGSSGRDTLRGSDGNDTIKGGSGADTLLGGNGNDTLSGGTGNDLLIGGLGIDSMTGGASRDRFDFNSIKESGAASSKRDHILDFNRGSDKIDLSTIDANTSKSGNQKFSFIGRDAFDDVRGELHYTRSNGDVVVSGDVNGDGKADFAITLDNLTKVSSGDFIL